MLIPEGMPGNPDWYGTERTSGGRPTKPILLFYGGDEPSYEQVLSSLKVSDTAWSTFPPLPQTFADSVNSFCDTTILIHLTRPQFPWLEEVKIGIEMDKYFDSVEIFDWENPTENEPGYYTLRFARKDDLDGPLTSTEGPWPL